MAFEIEDKTDNSQLGNALSLRNMFHKNVARRPNVAWLLRPLYWAQMWIDHLRRIPKLGWTWPFTLIYAILYSAIFGGREVEVKEHDRLALIPLDVGLNTLDFDKVVSNPARYLQSSYHFARLGLRDRFCEEPRVYEDLAIEVVAHLRAELNSGALDATSRGISLVLAKPSGSDPFLRILYGRSYTDILRVPESQEAMIDDRLLLPLFGSSAGSAFRKEAEFATKDEFEARTFTSRRDRYRRAIKLSRMLRDNKWRWAIPIRLLQPKQDGVRQPFCVLCVESDIDASLFPALQDCTVLYSAGLDCDKVELTLRPCVWPLVGNRNYPCRSISWKLTIK